MKRLLLLSCLVIATATTTMAQKIYSTKTGKITFFSKAPLEDIEAVNNGVESKIASSNGQMVFMLLIKGFQFPNRLMQDHFNENYMESNTYPKGDFKGHITNIKEIDFTKDGVYPAKIKGMLTIHGVTKEQVADGTIEVKGGKIIGKSTFDVLLKDYNIGGAMIGKKIAESIKVTVDCEYE